MASHDDQCVAARAAGPAGKPGRRLEPADYGTHPMRRTKATLVYRRTKDLRAVERLLGHAKLESTVRYFVIEVDDPLEIARQMEI